MLYGRIREIRLIKIGTMSVKKEDWKPLTFDEACERVRQTLITEEMTYKERLKMLMSRYGV
jgi:hypothetical protein